MGKNVGDEDGVVSGQGLVGEGGGRDKGREARSGFRGMDWIGGGAGCGGEICQGDFRELVLVGVADDGGDAGQRGDFCGGTLGVASGDNDVCIRILAADAADGGAGVLIGGAGDGASIQYDDFGIGGFGAMMTARFELAFEGGAVGLRGAASEVLDVKRGHEIIVASPAGSVGDVDPKLRRSKVTTPACNQALATVFFCMKHSRQSTGRPWVGRNGTVVSFPH